ncbi:TonB-dependent receptor domain-containing protein [Flavobacterium luminosum]|uniref:TonB-dependent receptor family protein n=1 Tax=Flavobacterium luminosum TaxID=2949086 RepID=A0ABT0TQQ3_9FLAO|nr:TonB-dependent receptor [Flavobacterium sp. HXWNR70]MCL9809700.1 TonB-dependent receptor family protein [Flavobacterium sp. HXWNR70]
MKLIEKSLLLVFLFCFSLLSAQPRQEGKRVTISGKVVEKSTSAPLDYATVTVLTGTNQVVSGAVTDAKGEFKIDIRPGKFTIKVEFMSFKTYEIKDKNISADTFLGTIALEDDAKMIDEVVIRAERTSVDIKLDKKVYTVGKDVLVRGGTVSDVLDNLPSISVSTEGAVALRGNENVRILIDGKPSNAASVNDALRLISADAIDKVEVVTNPSARYDAEGGGGIINILLKKGKNQGVNGTFIVSAGTPENTSGSANINVKQEAFNFFTTLGYNKRLNPGSTLINQENLNPDGSLRNYTEERRTSDRYGKGANINFGIELMLDKNTSWTNAFNYRNNKGNNDDNVFYYNYDNNLDFINTRQRFNRGLGDNENIEFTTNFVKKFKKDGHKLTIDGAFGTENEDENTDIQGRIVETNAYVSSEKTRRNNRQNRNLIQADYVIPLGKNSQFEAGFRGNYVDFTSDYQVQERRSFTDPYTDIDYFTNTLNYKENVTAGYTQFGSKISKFSFLLGLRYEYSHIEVNFLKTDDFTTKKYDNFFPSAFLTYEFSEDSNISVNYSRRITRPRDRFINPFASYTSNVNLFEGNPEINPAFTNAFDIGFLKKWDKLTFNTSLYLNHTTDSFQIVRRKRGDEIDGLPVVVNKPFNLSTEDKIGFEFNLNYNFKKWWKLNGNFNFFHSTTDGEFNYVDVNNNPVTINFDRKATSWFSRLTSRITLPYKIEWQTNGMYFAPQKTAQGTSKGIASANLGFSKDILKDMGTLSFNVNDVFNSRKRIQDIQLPGLNSYSEMQFRKRSFTFSFTYRFNKKKTDKDFRPRQNDNNGDGDIMG